MIRTSLQTRLVALRPTTASLTFNKRQVSSRLFHGKVHNSDYARSSRPLPNAVSLFPPSTNLLFQEWVEEEVSGTYEAAQAKQQMVADLELVKDLLGEGKVQDALKKSTELAQRSPPVGDRLAIWQTVLKSASEAQNEKWQEIAKGMIKDLTISW